MPRILREDILAGRLKSREPLLLASLAERFGTSVIPIRDALHLLRADGLVELRSHHTARVADYSPAEIEDLYRIRTLLDCEAVRLAHGKLAGEQLKLIHVEIDRMEQASEAGNDQEAFRLHSDMHFRIYQASGSDVLVRILRGLWDQGERYRNAVRNYRNISAWVEEHRVLVKLLERGTPEAAQLEMRAHVARTRDALLAAVSVMDGHDHKRDDK